MEESDNIAVDNQTQHDPINEQTANNNKQIKTLIIIIFSVVLFLVVSVLIVKHYYYQKKVKILEKNVIPDQPEKSEIINELNKKLDFKKEGIETKRVGTKGFSFQKGVFCNLKIIKTNPLIVFFDDFWRRLKIKNNINQEE